MSETTGQVVNGALLPHERRWVQALLPEAVRVAFEAQQSVGEANAASGGDWAFDDPATQAAGHEAVLTDKNKKDLLALMMRGETDYPDADDPRVCIGSRALLRMDKPLDHLLIDIAGARVPGLPEDEVHDVGRVTVESPLGAAAYGHVIGDHIAWEGPRGRRLGATVLSISQTAQKEFYDGVLQGRE